MQDDTFMRIVQKELHGEATEEEITFLQSSDDTLVLWNKILGTMYANATDNIANLNTLLKNEEEASSSLDPEEWSTRKREIEQKKKSSNGFLSIVRKKRLLVKSLRMKMNSGKDARRSSICDGYRRALHDIKRLMGKYALDPSLAIEFAELYEEYYMHEIWAKNPNAPEDYAVYFDEWLDQFLKQQEEN